MPRLQDQRQHELRRLNDVLLRKRRLTKKRLGQVGCQPDNPVRCFDEVATLEFVCGDELENMIVDQRPQRRFCCKIVGGVQSTCCLQ